MTAIYLLRHPETTWNSAGRYQGRLDTPLSDEGKRQLEARADSFRGETLDAVVCSPLFRAHTLAEAIAQLTRAPLYVDARWTEIAQGPWEGLYVNEIKQRFPAMFDVWHTRPDEVCFPGGESLWDVRNRVRPVFDDLFQRFPKGAVAIVAHSVVVQLLVAASLGIDLRFLHNIRISNGGLSILCGAQAPATVLTMNSVEALYRSPVASARSMGCL